VADNLRDLLLEHQPVSKTKFAELAMKAGLPRDEARAFIDIGVSEGTVAEEDVKGMKGGGGKQYLFVF
jgi:hypothetical protein